MINEEKLLESIVTTFRLAGVLETKTEGWTKSTFHFSLPEKMIADMAKDIIHVYKQLIEKDKGK